MDNRSPSDISEDKKTAEFIDFVKEMGMFLEFITEDRQTRALCLAAVEQDGMALQHVAKKTAEICLAAVKQTLNAFTFVPDEFKTEAFFLAAAKHNVSALQHLPDRLKTEAFYLAAVTQDVAAFQHVPDNFKIDAICLAAVKQDGKMLQLVPSEASKKYCIDQVTVEKILSDNYSVHRYFPVGSYKNEINQFLSKIEHVVVVENEDALSDKEVKDSYHVYANKVSTTPDKTRRGKTILVYSEDLHKTLGNLKNNQAINLVLLGHGSDILSTSAGMNVIDMIDTLKQSPNITRLTLLSCESARASLLAEEEKSIAAFKNSQDALFSGDCGLIYMTKSPVNKVEQDKILKNQDACYVLIEENNQKTCIFLQKNANPKKIALNDEKFESCKNQLYGANKTFKIPKGGSEYQIVRGPGNYLKLSEKQYMHDVFENIEGNKFNKKNPAYKAAKNTYPFLRGVEIQSTDENEMKKLKHSLLQVVAETIKATPEIKQNVVVKGYRGLVHVDLEEGGFHNVSKPIYTKSYSSNNSPLLFGKKDNIDRPELKKQRTKQIQDMLTGEPAKIAKSIKVHIRKP